MNMPTLVEALQTFREQGFVHDFNLEHSSLFCSALSLRLYPDDFEVLDMIRFEGDSNPDDSSVLYAIRSATDVRGTFLMAYGAYADGASAEIVRKLADHRNQ